MAKAPLNIPCKNLHCKFEMRWFLLVLCASSLAGATTCAGDIASATVSVGAAGVDIAKAVASCSKDPAGCAEDISNTASSLAKASADVADAVQDCGGPSATAQCVSDVSGAAASLGSASSAVAKAVTDCGASPVKAIACGLDVAGGAADVTKAAKGIAAATSDCKGNSTVGVGADPSGGWLSYALYTAPSPTDTITRLSAKMTVPDAPTTRFGGEPAFWFGVQTAKGDGALVQPIMAKWLGGSFYMFHEIFDWTDGRDSQGRQVKVAPGDVVEASVSFVKGSGKGLGTYNMNMTSQGTGQVLSYSYDLLSGQTETEATAYFVLEHQPMTCKQLPPNGNVKWEDVAIEVNGQAVENAQWVAKQEQPKCSSQARVLDSQTIEISWTA